MPQVIRPEASVEERLAFSIGRYEDAKNVLLEIADALDHEDIDAIVGRVDALTLATACVDAEQALFRLHEKRGVSGE